MLSHQSLNFEPFFAILESALEAAFFVVHVVLCLDHMLAGDVICHVFFEDATPTAKVALELSRCLVLLHKVLFKVRDGVKIF